MSRRRELTSLSCLLCYFRRTQFAEAQLVQTTEQESLGHGGIVASCAGITYTGFSLLCASNTSGVSTDPGHVNSSRCGIRTKTLPHSLARAGPYRCTA